MITSSSSTLLLPLFPTMLLRRFQCAVFPPRSQRASPSSLAVPSLILEVIVVLTFVARYGRTLVFAGGKEYNGGHNAVGEGYIWEQIRSEEALRAMRSI